MRLNASGEREEDTIKRFINEHPDMQDQIVDYIIDYFPGWRINEISEAAERIESFLHTFQDSCSASLEFNEDFLMALTYMISEGGFYDVRISDIRALIRAVILAEQMGILLDD